MSVCLYVCMYVCVHHMLHFREVSVEVWLGLVEWAGPARTKGRCPKQQRTGEPTAQWRQAVGWAVLVTLYSRSYPTSPTTLVRTHTNTRTHTQLEDCSGSYSWAHWPGDQIPGLHADSDHKPRPHTPTRTNEHRMIVLRVACLHNVMLHHRMTVM